MAAAVEAKRETTVVNFILAGYMRAVNGVKRGERGVD